MSLYYPQPDYHHLFGKAAQFIGPGYKALYVSKASGKNRITEYDKITDQHSFTK